MPVRTLRSAIAVWAVLFAACAPGGEQASGVKGVGQDAPAFSLEDLKGKKVQLDDFKGKVVLIDFWATYCLPCHEAIPVLQKLQDQFGEKGFSVVGVSVDAYTGYVPEFVKEHKMGYTVVLDPDQSTAKAYGFSQLPTTFLIGREGKIRRKWLGYDAGIGQEIAGEIKTLLESSTKL